MKVDQNTSKKGFIIVLTFQSVIALAWTVLTKWIVIGQRKDGPARGTRAATASAGSYTSPAYHGFSSGRMLGPLAGSAYYVWYLRAMGANIGRNCAIYPGGRTGLMTEPDLVQLGDNVALDDCSVVAHINLRGKFALSSLKIGDGCVMRSGSRLLSGASMEDSSMLCEHMLLPSGDASAGLLGHLMNQNHGRC
ncbi:hypothetical protein GGX14DRAFT_637608 [Mycena pura]|uniref:Uncharacterized protein n=1 Tax=Mycena pura TaxID=153505 RepID=A0AAD6VDB2_9AGAR|nr:hypothetical protein GGX14DRAFT_637608 [Mycena pura]